jgi:hypothetical protein
MAPNQEPVGEEEFEALREEMEKQREELRNALADDLGGDPEDYDAEKYLNDCAGGPVADVGE